MKSGLDAMEPAWRVILSKLVDDVNDDDRFLYESVNP